VRGVFSEACLTRNADSKQSALKAPSGEGLKRRENETVRT